MNKGKGAVIAAEEEEDDDDDEEEHSSSSSSNPSPPVIKVFTRNVSSKYDFVKVKVWLGENADHYYVLSRFLLSRMLTVTKIPNHVAIKIALELKKLLIDNSLLDVSQTDLEANLFKLMGRRGYGEEYVNRYKMMTRFHHQRVPFVVLVCGTACVGKSTIATQLAQRLNLPNVLQTDMVYELLRTATDAPLASSPVWAREFSSSEELITEFCRECRVVRKGLAGDLKKAMKDGKPIIIEGSHLDPSIYLMDDENKSSTDLTAKVEIPNLEASENKNVIPDESDLSSTRVDEGEKNCSYLNEKPVNETSNDSMKNVSDKLESMDIGAKDEMEKDPETNEKPPLTKEKSKTEPIIVPIVLKMAEFDHKALLEEWVTTRTFSDKCLIEDKDKLMSNLKTIQDYLCSFKYQGLTVVNMSPTTFPQTLDWLHSHLLQCIEQGISPVSEDSDKQLLKN